MALSRFLMILTLALVIALVIAIWFFPSDDDFQIENPLWNGTRVFNSKYAARPLASFTDLPLSPQGTTLVLIPYLECTPSELEQVKDLVARGGRLILADDYGRGNQVLDYLGLTVRFSRQALLDPLINYKNTRFPRITHLEPGPLTDNITSLVFNHATSLVNVSPPDTLALSSPFSFLDLDGDQIQNDGEPAGPFPVISQHALVDGQVILVADPSLFINSMETLGDNGRLMQNIFATSSSLYVDQSHLAPSELHRTRSLLAQARAFFLTPPGTSGLVVLALAMVLKPLWLKKKEKEQIVS